MEKLNHDCILCIFQKLDFHTRVRSELVCRKWHHILRNPHAYSDMTKLDTSEFSKPTTSNYYQQSNVFFEPMIHDIIKRCGHYLRHIEFGGRWAKITQPMVDQITNLCHQLKRLDFGCTIIDADISPLLKTIGHQLEYFSLEETSWTHANNEFRVNPYLRNLGNILKLNLRRFSFVGNELVDVGLMLERLDISGAKNICAKDFSDFLNLHARNLTGLELCPMPSFLRPQTLFGNERVVDEDYYDTAKKIRKVDKTEFNNTSNQLQMVINAFAELKSLQTLNIGYIYETPRTCSMASFSELQSIRSLHIQECNCLDTPTLRQIVNNTPHLRTLRLIKCANIDNYSCISSVKLLRELEIRQTIHLEDSDIERIAQNGVIKRLRLDQCPNITNQAITRLAALCPNLCELEMAKCENIKDEIFAKNEKWSNLKNLQVLSFNGTVSITNKSMKELANTKLLETLHELDISHNKNIDDTTINLFHKIIGLTTLPEKKKTLIIYVFQTGITSDIQHKVFPEIELIF